MCGILLVYMYIIEFFYSLLFYKINIFWLGRIFKFYYYREKNDIFNFFIFKLKKNYKFENLEDRYVLIFRVFLDNFYINI